MLNIKDELTSIQKKQRTVDSMLEAGILAVGNNHYEDVNKSVDIDILYQKEATIGVGSVGKRGVLQEHSHAHSRHYLICLTGKFIIKFEGLFRVLSPGECVSLDPGVAHSTRCVQEGKLIFINVPADAGWGE